MTSTPPSLNITPTWIAHCSELGPANSHYSPFASKTELLSLIRLSYRECDTDSYLLNLLDKITVQLCVQFRSDSESPHPHVLVNIKYEPQTTPPWHMPLFLDEYEDPTVVSPYGGKPPSRHLQTQLRRLTTYLTQRSVLLKICPHLPLTEIMGNR